MSQELAGACRMKKRKKKRKNSKQFNRQFKKKFFTKKSAIIIVCTVIILGAFWGAYQKVERKAAKYQKTIDELKTEVKNLDQTNKTLEKEKNNINTDEFKERIARERLGMIKEGEVSLQEDQEGETTSTTAVGSTEEATAESENQNGNKSGQTTEAAGQMTQSQTDNKEVTQKTD